MKKILLSIATALTVFSSVEVYAQATTFTTAATNAANPNFDTVYMNVQQSSANINDYITGTVAGGMTISWKAVASNFPADWLSSSALGICDNKLCRTNLNNQVWNASTVSGNTFTSSPYLQNQPADFHMALDLGGTTSVGKYWMTVQVSDANNAASTKMITFVVSQYTTGIANTTKAEEDVMLYPNPATDEVNVTYNASANIKTIALYNIIGKVVKVYNTLDNSGAKLNIDNVPSGIYFIRLMDSQGHIVATRKFTRQ